MDNQATSTGATTTSDTISRESLFSHANPHQGMQHLSERRCQQRHNTAYPALVRGVDAEGHIFEEFTYVDNISAGGLFLRLPRNVAPGQTLFLTFRFAHSDLLLPRFAIRGVVRRTMPLSHEICGVGLELTQRRLLDKHLHNVSKSSAPRKTLEVAA